MTTDLPDADLFGHAAPPDLRRSTGLRGRGATEPLDWTQKFDAPNPTGGRTLRFKFRPLKAWSADRDRLRAACRVVIYYFQQIGGFRLADDAVVRRAWEALADLDERACRWAVDAKRRTLVDDCGQIAISKLDFVGHPQSFRYDVWLEKSPRYQQLRARAAESQRARLRDQQRAAQRAAEPPPLSPEKRRALGDWARQHLTPTSPTTEPRA